MDPNGRDKVEREFLIINTVSTSILISYKTFSTTNFNTMQRILMKSRPFLMKSSINQTSLHLSTISSSSYAKQSYTDRQAKLGRPVSPHVTIYRLGLGVNLCDFMMFFQLVCIYMYIYDHIYIM
jgi:hypothetical protein